MEKIGQTEMGKTIYNNFDHPAHADFTSNDHTQAAALHRKLAHELEIKSKLTEDDFDSIDAHRKNGRDHDGEHMVIFNKAAKEKNLKKVAAAN